MFRIIPIFLPQSYCRHNCSFCNQRTAVGKVERLRTEDIKEQVSGALSSIPEEAAKQVAFYGGTFTQLPMEIQEQYLSAVKPFLDNGDVSSIRVSTRPDSISQNSVQMLRKFGVTVVEIGVQVLDDEILKSIGRGHNTADVERAVSILKSNGLTVGLQIMVGLPGETTRKRFASWRRILELKPDLLRVHPTIVLSGSRLEVQYKRGEYQPLAMDEAVSICAGMVIEAELNGIRVIRIGVQSSPALQADGAIVAGPWHPSFGQLVQGEIYYRLVTSCAKKMGQKNGIISVFCSSRALSAVRGLSKRNVQRFKTCFPDAVFEFKVGDGVGDYEIFLERQKTKEFSGLGDVVRQI